MSACEEQDYQKLPHPREFVQAIDYLKCLSSFLVIDMIIANLVSLESLEDFTSKVVLFACFDIFFT